MDSEAILYGIKLVLVCIVWYISSASGNIIGKLVLTEFPYPMTVTLVQLISAAVYLGPILGLLGVPHTGNVPKRYYFSMIIPLALGKFLSSLSSHVSIWIVSVSYAHTVKATLPLFTVVLSRVLLGETQTYPVYLSLLPIIGGVIIATLTEVSFEFMGLLSALGATLGFSLMTIFSKKCLHETGLHHLRLLVLLCRISALCFFPVWLIFDLRKIIYSEDTVVEGKSLATPVLLLFFDGLFSMLQNVFAFTVLAMVSTLSYAVANATKRVVIIGASLFVLQNPITISNFIGMMIAIFGVLVYNKAKYDQNQAKKRETILPYIRSDSNLNAHYKGSLPHSKSMSNLRENGYVHPDDHILLQNNIQMDHVTLLPPMKDDKERGSFGLSDLHSRGVHHV